MILREINPKTEAAHFDEIVRLRQRVWSLQMPMELTADDLIDRFDPIARHWAVMVDDQPVAAARLSLHDRLEDVPEAECLAGVFAAEPPAPIGFLSRLVVSPEYRGRGLSRQLDEIRMHCAEEADCRSLLAIVYDVSGESRRNRFLSYGFHVQGRGQRDTHPKFSWLPGPVVVMRVTAPTANSTHAKAPA